METKKYWQAKDADSRVFLYSGKPLLVHGKTYHITNGTNCTPDLLFPITLKPLQIAEITVNENGTWSYEIEREEGWYFVKHKSRNEVTLWRYKSGEWHYAIGGMVDDYHFDDVKISSTRIPDECTI